MSLKEGRKKINLRIVKELAILLKKKRGTELTMSLENLCDPTTFSIINRYTGATQKFFDH